MWVTEVLILHILFSCRLEFDKDLHGHIRLDHKCFEAAHLKYAILTTHMHYPEIRSTVVPIHWNVMETLQEFTALFYDAFSNKYASTNI